MIFLINEILDGIALINIRNSLDSPGNANFSVWDSSVDYLPCTEKWPYVYCDNNNRVTWLSFGGLYMHGTISPELFKLDELKQLSIYSNNFYGTIPTEISRLNLYSFMASYNELTGPIPTELGLLTNLEYLFLHNNHFIGTIPSELGSLSLLLTLSLNDNNLTGAIPDELIDICSIDNPYFLILLECNALTGPIPNSCINNSTDSCSIFRCPENTIPSNELAGQCRDKIK